MKTCNIQAAFARKREFEHNRNQRTQAVSNYYSHWGKQTSKYENWTNPEYYDKAEEKMKNLKAKKEKEKQLEERREKLRQLFMQEKIIYEEMIKDMQQRKPRARRIPIDMMEKIDQDFKENQNQKRRLDLEAKLYGRLRHGRDDENFLLDSKTDNQVLAKLNWLDKKIEEQRAKEEQQKLNAERSLRMQEEIRKTEEHQKLRQEIREKEISEIRALQEKHVTELKDRELEAESLKSQANYLQTAIDQIDADFESLKEKTFVYDAISPSNNLRNIKAVMRKRSEDFTDAITSDIELLQRLDKIIPNNETTQNLISKLTYQLEAEKRNLSLIKCMYDSEAKLNLQKNEDLWRRLIYERRMDMMNLLREQRLQLRNKFYDNQQRQKELIDIRTTHLSSIENSNKQLKLLIKEEELLSSPRALAIESPRTINDTQEQSKSQPQSQVQPAIHKVSDSFTNLNLDCLSGEVDSKPSSARSSSRQDDSCSNSSRGPRFGRKKVAWT